MSQNFPHWWERASRDEIRRRQSASLRQFLTERAVPFTAHYRRLFAEHGIDPHSIRSVDDLPRLPFTSKKDFENPRDFVVIPDEAALRKQARTIRLALANGPWRVKQLLENEFRPILLTSTTGRSSAPVPFLYSRHDLARLEEGGRRLMQLGNSPSSWKFFNAFPFAPHLAFWQAHYAGIGRNVFMLSSGGGKTMGTEGNLRLIDRVQPDALIAMPTFLYHLVQEAVGHGSRWPQLKRLVLGGEKVPQGMRRKLTELCAQLGAEEVTIMSTYGFTEAKIAWSECAPPAGEPPSGFHVYADMGIVEVIDPATGQPVPDGTSGEIVFTQLDARGTIVLRYRTGDLIEGGLVWGKCPWCGRTGPRLVGRISRVSDIKELQIGKLKGTLVDFNALENILDDTPNLGAWQIELRKRANDPLESDQVIVHAVPLDDHEEQLRSAIAERFAQVTEFSPNEIQFHDWETMKTLQGVGKELKEKKVVDHRPAAG